MFGNFRGRELTALAEPDAAVVLERWPQRELEPAGALGAIAGRNLLAIPIFLAAIGRGGSAVDGFEQPRPR